MGNTMSRKDNKGLVHHQLSSVLPDDRPITAINIIEDIDKCPKNFTVVTKTYDLDADADLWRESGLFIKKKSRYICFSKTEGLPHSIVERISIVDEREPPPDGFSMISHTVDSMQKAWRKRQLCYKIRNKDLCASAVSDIILCSKLGKGTKMAPDEFTFAGIINGLYVCYKTVPVVNSALSAQPYANIELFQAKSPTLSNGTPHRVAPERPPKPKYTPKSSNGQKSTSPIRPGKQVSEENEQDYEILSPISSPNLRPTRPAPRPPPLKAAPVHYVPTIYGTLSGSSELDGVPFILNPLLSTNSNSVLHSQLPVIRVRTLQELEKEYSYDFRTERAT
ncbi:uncharacterized protein LOC106650108 isoform X2 [Trichogramma pretiosum]|uniref:uncharacterized protein LOC106650108 isoform X2 n=1 Tax=Trichogramma pretiosum TaxID=7493 RepID=UPI0006C967D5|nr:uncharacterized protein LOC106650108 isoform X2 [Trichogramma pretiosum]